MTNPNTAPSADSDGGAEKMSQALEALNLAREYVDNASSCMYDGTNGHGIRKEALRRLFVIDAAIASLKSTAQTGGEAVAPEAKWPIVPPANSRVGRVYLAGPMTGYENHNFPAFNAAADCLRAEGLEVVNPADHDLIEDAQWGDYMRYDIAQLAQCESIALLPGWDKSKGATLEVHIAKALGMTVRYLEGAEATPPAPPAPLPGKPLTKDQIAALLPLIKAEVDTLSDEGRYTFAGWLPIAVRLIEKHHGIAALSAQAAPEYRTGFDEAPSTFNAQDAAPGDYLPSVSKEQALEAFDSMLHVQKDAEAHATLRRFIEQSGRERVSADPLPRPLLTDLEIQGLRRQARNDPRCADQHWFILMVRAIESYYGVTGAAAQSQPLVEPTAARVSFLLEQKSVLPHWENLMAYQSEDSARKALPVFRKTTSRDIRIVRQTREVVAVDSVAASPPQHQVKKGEPS